MDVENPANNDDSEEEDDEDSVDDSDDSSDYSDDDDDDDDALGYGNLLQDALFPQTADAAAAPPDARSPLQRWRDYLTKIQRRQTTILKFLDVQLDGELKVLSSFAVVGGDDYGGGAVTTRWKTELLEAIATAAVNPDDPTSSPGYFTHAMIGAKMLQLLGDEGQKQLFRAIASHATLSFLQLKGIPDAKANRTDNSNSNNKPVSSSISTALSMEAVVEAFGSYPTPVLGEMELAGITFASKNVIQQWSIVLESKRSSLRQANLIVIEPAANNNNNNSKNNSNNNNITSSSSENTTQALQVGWLDPILLALALPTSSTTSPMDELKLVCESVQYDGNGKIIAAISPLALSTLLQHKKKWWRLSLDGLGLNDEHLHVLTTMFRRDDTCKAGDLLSLERNPCISSNAYQEFFEGCFFWKRRMGFIKVDDKDWQGQFDLVRSMNNLHNRLDFVVSAPETRTAPAGQYMAKCSFASRDKWMEWLEKLGTGLAWEDDKHRINYLWFTLLEKPEFIYSHA